MNTLRPDKRIRRVLKGQMILILFIAFIPACRGNKSPNPPIHLQPNMDHQKRFEAQEENNFFKDKRAMRPQVPNTIALGELKVSRFIHQGVMRDNSIANRIPFGVDEKFLKRGQARYDIYCSRCHGAAGDGKGILITRKITVPPTSYMEPRLLQKPVGHFFQVITKGIRNMPSLGAQIPAYDRWAIAAYVRVLQRAGHADLGDVPVGVAKSRGWKKKASSLSDKAGAK